MTASRAVSAIALSLLALVVAGCATTLPPPRYPIPTDARHALDLLEERCGAFSGLRTLADVTVQRGTERRQVRAVVLARAPASARFEALSPMGSPLLVATIQDGRITAYDATTNEAQVGPATPEVTGRVLGLPFEPEDLVAVLGGCARPPRDIRIARLLPPDELGSSLELIGEVNRRRIWLELSTGVVRQLELTGGRAEARIRYLRDPAGEMRGFDLTAMMSYLTASVRYSNPVFDTPPPPELFALDVPKSATIKPLR
jgi:outer membrane lipoprotein-sorting protein